MIDELASWSSTWQLALALAKCFDYSVGGPPKRNTNAPTYNIGLHQLETVDHASDLGFKKELENIVRVASVGPRLISMCLNLRDPLLTRKHF